MHDQRGHASICRSRSREWRRGGGNKSMWLFKGRNAWLLDLALCMWEQSCIIWVLRHQQWVYAWWNWMSWFYLIFKIWMRKKKQKPVCVLHKCLIESKDDTLLISVHVLIMKLVPRIRGATFPRAVSERKYAIPYYSSCLWPTVLRCSISCWQFAHNAAATAWQTADLRLIRGERAKVVINVLEIKAGQKGIRGLCIWRKKWLQFVAFFGFEVNKRSI